MPEGVRYTGVATGGSKSIGRVICQAFFRNRYPYFFNYLSDEKAAGKTEKLVSKK